MKLALEGVLKECNRMASEYELQNQKQLLKSKLLRLEMDFQSGIIDNKTYQNLQSQILKNIKDIGKVTNIEDEGSLL